MRTVKHLFSTPEEAVAFVIGVDWANDSALEHQGTHQRADHVEVVYTDEDHTSDATFDHRRNR